MCMRKEINMEDKKINQVEFIAKSAVVAALYAIFTVLNPFSYYGIQFRISEILILLVFIDKRYTYSLVIGCILANLASPLGLVDIVFGSLATLLACLLIARTKNLFVATLWPALTNGIIIGFILYKMLDLPFFLSAFQVFFGEFVVLSIAGYILFRKILKDKNLMRKLRFN